MRSSGKSRRRPSARVTSYNSGVCWAGAEPAELGREDGPRWSRPGECGLFVEAVQTLKPQPGPVRQHYERLLRAKGKQKGTGAAACRLCCYVYWMMKEGRS